MYNHPSNIIKLTKKGFNMRRILLTFKNAFRSLMETQGECLLRGNCQN